MSDRDGGKVAEKTKEEVGESGRGIINMRS